MFDGLNAGKLGRNDPTQRPCKKTQAALPEKKRPDEEAGVDNVEEDGVDQAAAHAEADEVAPHEFVDSSIAAVSGL